MSGRFILDERGRFLDENDVEVIMAPSITSDIIHVGHLAAFVFPVAVHLPGGTGATVIRIRVAFTCHCFTEKWDPARHAGRPVILDPTRPRAYDQRRYDLSKGLPDLVRGMKCHKVYMTPQKRNYMAFDGRVILEDGSTYRMFFAMKRKAGADHDLEMMVESAYPTNDPIKGMSVRFAAVVSATFLGKKISYKR